MKLCTSKHLFAFVVFNIISDIAHCATRVYSKCSEDQLCCLLDFIGIFIYSLGYFALITALVSAFILHYCSRVNNRRIYDRILAKRSFLVTTSIPSLTPSLLSSALAFPEVSSSETKRPESKDDLTPLCSADV